MWVNHLYRRRSRISLETRQRRITPRWPSILLHTMLQLLQPLLALTVRSWRRTKYASAVRKSSRIEGRGHCGPKNDASSRHLVTHQQFWVTVSSSQPSCLRKLNAIAHFQYSDAAMAKFKFWPSFIVNVVIPIKLPLSSNTPPPDDPFDIGAVI